MTLSHLITLRQLAVQKVVKLFYREARFKAELQRNFIIRGGEMQAFDSYVNAIFFPIIQDSQS